MILKNGFFLFVFAILFSSRAVLASGSCKTEIDPSWKNRLADLHKRTEAGNIPIRISVPLKNTYQVDGSAVVNLLVGKMMGVSGSYEWYTRWGVPQLEENRIVPGEGTLGKTLIYKNGRLTQFQDKDELVLWTHMKLNLWGVNFGSRHYMKVMFREGLTPSGAASLLWDLTRQQPGWNYPEDLEFNRFSGSWYMEPVSLSGKDLLYVRYCLDTEISNPLASFLEGKLKTELQSGVQKLFQVLVEQARKE